MEPSTRAPETQPRTTLAPPHPPTGAGPAPASPNYARAFGYLEQAVDHFLKDWRRHASSPTRLGEAVNTLRSNLAEARRVAGDR